MASSSSLEVLFEEEENELSFSFLTGTKGFETLYKRLIPFIPQDVNTYYEKVVLYCETNQSIPEYIRSQYVDINNFTTTNNETNNHQSSYFRAIFRSCNEIDGLITEEILTGDDKFLNHSPNMKSMFQRKVTFAKQKDILPVYIEGQVLFVDYTVKESTEYNISHKVFTTNVINQSSDTDGSFRKIAGVDRKCWFIKISTHHTVRISLGKKYSFTGTSIARSPNDVVYYIEFEIEYNKKYPIKNISQLITKCLGEYLTIEDLSIIIKDGYDLTIKQTERLDQLFDTFVRNFVSINSFKSSCSTNCSQLLLAPKWDGLRGFGVWYGSEAIIFTTLGLRSWNNLPVISPQRILFQAEVFFNTIDNNDEFIVTEIFGVAKQTINMLYSIFIRENMYSGRSVGAGLYNGTMTAVNGQLSHNDVRCTYFTIKLEHSISVISTLRQIDQHRFTSYISNDDNFDTILKILNNKVDIEKYHIQTSCLGKFDESFVQKGCDGLLGICVFKDGSDGVYIKLKKYQTIELEYDILNSSGKKCKSRDGTEYDIDGLPCSYNWSHNAYVQRFVCLEARFNTTNSKLEFIKWRFDKLHPDSDDKIKKIMLSI
jgi:hypothetical protein